MEPHEIASITTTEVCNLTCVMCHFNGPNAMRRQRTLSTGEVRKFVSSIPPCELWFAATGDFLMDPNALDHLRAAVEYGHRPCILTNGQLLTAQLIDEILALSVREIRLSVDAIEADAYRRIRRGGELGNLLRVCEELRARKRRYPDLKVSVANVVFRKTINRQEEFIRFWTGKVDEVVFQAEYYDTFKFRTMLTDPGERVDCQMRVFLLPNGQMAPCCATTVYQHERDVEWLPHISDTSPEQALQRFKHMYADPASPLRELCAECQWWIMFKRDKCGQSPFTRVVPLDEDVPAGSWTECPDADARPGVLRLDHATACNGSGLERDPDGSLLVTTLPDQWAYACALRLEEPDGVSLAADPRLWIRVRATVEEGRIGASIAAADLKSLVSREHHRKASGAETVFDLHLDSPRPGQWLVLRNTAPDGTVSRARIHEVQVIAAEPPVAGGFIGIETLLPPRFSPPPMRIEPPPPPPADLGLGVFETESARAITRARIEHLAALRLPLAGKSVIDAGCGVGHLSQYFAGQGCRVVCVDARPENLARLRELYPGRETHVINVESDPLARLGRFDIVFSYGLLYHCENPIAALRNLASCCDEMLLLETVITDHPRAIYQLTDEPREVKDQAVAGFGCRPSPAFVAMALSRMGFPFVYTTRSRPAYPDFQVEWKGDGECQRDDHLLRCIFIASRRQLDSPSLELLVHTPGDAAAQQFTAVRPEDADEVWIDVGAHAGESTLEAARKRPGLRVYAFEPNLTLAAGLMGRLPNYIVLPMAVAEHDGSAAFHLNRFDAASSLLPFHPEGLRQWVSAEALGVAETVPVPTIRLDTFLNRAGIRTVDYLHVDAQGADLAVVRSAGDRLHDVRRIKLEVQLGAVPLYEGAATKEDTVRFLESAGFQLESSERQSADQEENLTFVRRG
ncbi:MAG: FkbM family methyltransferase [Acidobacteria bacterium]|nr:FkbM family methyltransferase [Acidobacteriota bacterium]